MSEDVDAGCSSHEDFDDRCSSNEGDSDDLDEKIKWFFLRIESTDSEEQPEKPQTQIVDEEDQFFNS